MRRPRQDLVEDCAQEQLIIIKRKEIKMAFYDEIIDEILAVIDEDRSKNLSFLIYQDIGRILDNFVDDYCKNCDFVTKCDT